MTGARRAGKGVAVLLCWIFGHRYQVAQEFSDYARRVVCPHCGGDWAMNDDVRAFIAWDDDFDAFYKTSGHIVHNPWPTAPRRAKVR